MQRTDQFYALKIKHFYSWFKNPVSAMSLKHSLNWLWMIILHICLLFLAIISLFTRTVILLSWTLRSSQQDLPVGTFPGRTFLWMAAAQERISFSSTSHWLSDYVCQAPSTQKMNWTLAPFKTLTEVSDIQRKLQKSVFSAIVKAAINIVVE